MVNNGNHIHEKEIKVLQIVLRKAIIVMDQTSLGIRVRWDEAKNESNIRKHGIDFKDAALVFADAGRLEFYDVKHSVDEDRYIVLGLAGRVLFVVYTMQEGAYRLISARIATKREERRYYEYNRSYS